MANRAFRDRLSDLPLSIIVDILGRISTREAIRTSILSRQWRYSWITIPYLVFRCTNVANELIEGFEEKTTNFISDTLLHHKGHIDRFVMFYSSHFKISRVGEWMLCLSKKDIKELIIQINYEMDDNANLLNSSLYSCSKLTELELWNFRLHSPPSSFNGFLNLTSLVLRGGNLSPEGVESLLANSPLLERLTLMIPGSSGRFTLSAPNLKYICLLGEYTDLSLHAPLLAEIYVNLKAEEFTVGRRNYSNFFHGLTNLVELTGHKYFTRYLSIGIESCQHTLMLHHLWVLELTRVNFDDMKEMSVVARLINGAPNLKRFHILSSNEGNGLEAPDITFEEFGCESDFALKKLKLVTIAFVRHHHSGMKLIKFLLESSPVLEKLKIRFLNSGQYHDLSTELEGFHRASPKAKILVNY